MVRRAEQLESTLKLESKSKTIERPPTLWADVFFGPGAARSVAVRSAVTIGRGDDCAVALDDRAVSREHARLSLDGDVVCIEDLSSQNGTFVDGAPIGAAVPLRDGAIVRVGETLLRVGRRVDPWTPGGGGALVGGSSLAMLRRQIGLLGPSDLSVAILGETGTGKEIVARELHAASGRKGPLVAVNCAAISPQLIESELFGHVRGAFTDAAARLGLVASANLGTLFLDEIGELPLELQPKLLRVLEDGMVRAVGAERAQRVDVRVVCATHRELGELVERGAFRADLLARIAPVELRLPPLRERVEDIPALAAHLLDRARARITAIDAEAMEALVLHAWPMNVRELDNVLRATVVLGEPAGRISRALLPARLGVSRHMTRDTEAPPRRPRSKEELRIALERALARHEGNVRRSSDDLGLSRTHAYRLIKEWAIDPERFRRSARARHRACNDDGR